VSEKELNTYIDESGDEGFKASQKPKVENQK
jgi:hypothetical protein